MNSLLTSDAIVHIINFLPISSIISLSETKKNIKDFILSVINENIIPCRSLIEYIALTSERKYTTYSKYFVDEELVRILAKIEGIHFEEKREFNFIQTLLEFNKLDIIKDNFHYNHITNYVHHIHEFGLSYEAKQYIIDCVIKSLKERFVSLERISLIINSYNTPLLTKTLKEIFPEYEFTFRESRIGKFINGDINSFCTQSDYNLFIPYVIMKNQSTPRDLREFKKLTIRHFGFFLGIVDKLVENKDASRALTLILMSISDNVFNEILNKKYLPLLSLIDINYAFLRRISWKRYDKLIPWCKSRDISFNLSQESLVVTKLYLLYYPDRVTDVVLKILQNRYCLNMIETKKKVSHIMTYYKCDYKKITTFISSQFYDEEITSFITDLVKML